MIWKRLMVFLLVTLPGLAAISTCGYYLFMDWSALISAFARFEVAAASGSDRQLRIAATLDGIYRLNAFADGVGVMLGAILFGVGLIGMFLLRDAPEQPSSRRSLAAAVGVGGVSMVATALLLVSLATRVGETNNLRRAVIRGDASMAKKLVQGGADPHDRLWWGRSAADAADSEAMRAALQR